MSASERPDLAAFKELETLVRNLGEELAMFRRRAIAAEGQLKDGAQAPRTSVRGAAFGVQSGDLATENEQLRMRVGRAEDRVRQMMERVRFLRQQLQAASPTPAARS